MSINSTSKYQTGSFVENFRGDFTHSRLTAPSFSESREVELFITSFKGRC
ncbi:hypothetical protein PORCAN_131 [Porphyromonas crevioricanis JCM 13913]|nr:hypothetical protein PORCAN_131 [Porphyromonas crevioricanis JCM 13913]